MKLVTPIEALSVEALYILIHTSVKLVTAGQRRKNLYGRILIHTSVKLVTGLYRQTQRTLCYFNPHEREARDIKKNFDVALGKILIHTSVKLVTYKL